MTQHGWPELMEGFPWFRGKGRFPLPAYSEFMPPPRPGCNLYTGETDRGVFRTDDPFGWRVDELEEECHLRPGLENAGRQIIENMIRFGSGLKTHHMMGHLEGNLKDNPFCPPELMSHAGHLPHEHFILLLPLALSKTQDDKGRVRWTLFGSSEQGPEKAFWNSFYTSPDTELPEQFFIDFPPPDISRIPWFTGQRYRGTEVFRLPYSSAGSTPAIPLLETRLLTDMGITIYGKG